MQIYESSARSGWNYPQWSTKALLLLVGHVSSHRFFTSCCESRWTNYWFLLHTLFAMFSMQFSTKDIQSKSYSEIAPKRLKVLSQTPSFVELKLYSTIQLEIMLCKWVAILLMPYSFHTYVTSHSSICVCFEWSYPAKSCHFCRPRNNHGPLRWR